MATIGPRQDLLGQHAIASDVYLIVDGWGMRYKDLAEGRRQIMAFLLPGDLCIDAADQPIGHCVGSLTSMRYGRIPLVQLEARKAASPALARAVWRKQLTNSARQLEWIANSGRPAYERTAHLLCEVFARAQAAGLTEGNSCDFPPTQFDLACALGLTAVHVNRTLQQLRAAGLIELRGRKLVVLDFKALEHAAQFDRDYLHLSSAS
jgi:CRP-like cAMP-binding protein